MVGGKSIQVLRGLFTACVPCLLQNKEEEQEAARFDAVFPCILSIIPTAVFNKKDPIVLGVDIVEGVAKVRYLEPHTCSQSAYVQAMLCVQACHHDHSVLKCKLASGRLSSHVSQFVESCV